MGNHNENTDVTVSALFPAPLITLTHDDVTAPEPRWSEGSSVLDRVALGDSHAARECIDQFGRLVWSIARHLTCTRADAEAAVQEIFADVWRNAGRYQATHGSEEVFIAMIARRRLIDRMRRATYLGPARAIGEDDLLGWGDSGNSADLCDEARAARRGILRLRLELQVVLELGVLHGLSHLEIADRLHMPLGTVKALMTRGLIQVREFMGNRK
jgi:RNA polymerase sigma-70 factor (ECF subfamily)